MLLYYIKWINAQIGILKILYSVKITDEGQKTFCAQEN